MSPQSELESWKSEKFQALYGGTSQSMNPSLDTILLELIAWLGFARACAHSARVQDVLLALQMDLQRMIGTSAISQAEDFSSFVAGRARWLEETREALECECPSRGFSELPGDTVSGAILDLLAIMTRRMSQDHQKRAQADSTVQEYLKRLPAILFAIARYEEWQADPQR